MAVFLYNYDSLLHSIDETTKGIINNLFHLDPDKAIARIKVFHPQKQTNSKDCGVYAIAWTTTIAFGKKPAERKICDPICENPEQSRKPNFSI